MEESCISGIEAISWMIFTASNKLLFPAYISAAIIKEIKNLCGVNITIVFQVIVHNAIINFYSAISKSRKQRFILQPVFSED